MTDRTRHLFYMVVFPLGHFSVDTPGGALWLLAPAVGLAWNLSPTEVGLLLTIHNLGAGLGYLPSGFLGDRFSRRGLMLTLTIWWVVLGYLIASIVSGYWAFAIMLAIAAMGAAAWHPMATGTMVQHMPERRALALGVHLTGGMLAEVIAPLAIGFLLAYVEWRIAFRIAIVPSVLMGVGMLYFYRHIAPSQEPAIRMVDLKELLSVWRTPNGVAMFGLGVTYSLSFVALMAMSPLFFQGYHGYSSAWAGTTFAAMLFGGGIAAPVMGQISDRFGRKQVVVLSALVAAGGLLFTAFSSHGIAMVLGVISAGTALAGMRPVYLAAAVEMTGRRETMSLGLIYAVMDGLGALGGLAAGIAGESDLRFSLVFAACASLLCAIFAMAHPFSQYDDEKSIASIKSS